MFNFLPLPAELRTNYHVYVVHDLFESQNIRDVFGSQKILPTKSYRGLALSGKQLYSEVESEWWRAMDKVLGHHIESTLLQNVPVSPFKQGLHLEFFRPYLLELSKFFHERLVLQTNTYRALPGLIKSFGPLTFRSDPNPPAQDGTLYGLFRLKSFVHLRNLILRVRYHGDIGTTFDYWTLQLRSSYSK
jgi:hypothetical protein